MARTFGLVEKPREPSLRGVRRGGRRGNLNWLGDIQDEIAALSAGGGSLAMTTKWTLSTLPNLPVSYPTEFFSRQRGWARDILGAKKNRNAINGNSGHITRTHPTFHSGWGTNIITEMPVHEDVHRPRSKRFGYPTAFLITSITSSCSALVSSG